MRAIPLLVACLFVSGCFGMGDDGDDDDVHITPSTASPTPTPTPTPSPSPTPPTNATPTPPTNTTPPPVTPTVNNTTAPPPVTIDIVSIAQGYDPSTVTVPVGTNVTWTNADPLGFPHTATSDDGSTFDTGSIAADASASVVLGTAGTYAYHCTIHPTMRATITVA